MSRCTYLLLEKWEIESLHDFRWEPANTVLWDTVQKTYQYQVSRIQALTYPLLPCDLWHVTSYFWLPQWSPLWNGAHRFACSEGGLNLNKVVCWSSFPTLSGIEHVRWYFHCSRHALESSHSCYLFTPVFLALLPFHMSNFRIKTATQLEGLGVSCLLIWVSFKSTYVVF